jgi:hypothetical protein
MPEEKVDTGEFGKIEQDLLGFLDKLSKKERLEKINDLLHRLNFERRLTDEDLVNMNDESLSSYERKKLDGAKTDQERDQLFTDFARLRYFRRCAWISYLNGESKEKPFTSKKVPIT